MGWQSTAPRKRLQVAALKNMTTKRAHKKISVDLKNFNGMADINSQNPKFMEFVFTGLDHGINSISDGGGPLVPFLMIQTDNKKELKRFVAEKYEEGINKAEQTLKDMKPQPDFALIAFDGFINWENKKYDAILVRAFDKTQDEGFQFCQRYVPKTNGTGVESIGNSAFIGKTTNLLSISTDKEKRETKQKKPWWKF